MNKLIAGGAVAALLLAAAPALADPTGFYVAGEVGYQQTADIDGTTLGVIPPFIITTVPATADFDGGWQAVGRVGYRFNDHWRVEMEGAWRASDVDTVNGGAFDASLDATTLMGNVLYDFRAPDAQLRPFVGAGIGAGNVEYDQNGTDDDSGFAWQVLGGASWALSDRMSLDATYRYVRIQDLEFGGLPHYEDDYSNQSLSVGVRYAFGGPR